MKKEAEVNNSHNGWSTLAILSFIISFLFFIPFSQIVSIILGIIALVKISKSKQRGKGLAIAGVVISVITFILMILILRSSSTTKELTNPTTITPPLVILPSPPKQLETPKPEIDCNSLTTKNTLTDLEYDELLRYPEKHIGEPIKIKNELNQIVGGEYISISTTLYSTNSIVTDLAKGFLAGDVIEFCGVFKGLKPFEMLGGGESDLPYFELINITLIKKSGEKPKTIF